MTTVPKNNALDTIEGPWNNNQNSIWLASAVSLQRNVEKFLFPSKMTSEKRRQLFSLASQQLMETSHIKDLKLLKAEEVSPLDKEFLYEHFLALYPFPQAHVGEGFLFNKEGTFFGGLNLQDHLYLQVTDCTGDLEKTWNKLAKIDIDLGKGLPYSYSSRFGFMTTDPADSGTALRLRIFLQVPALIHSKGLEDFFQKHRDEAIGAVGLQGKPNEFTGDIIVVKNNYSLGVSEENIISQVRSFCTKMIVHEKSLRSQLKESVDFKDKVSRAYGILMHSYQIETVEAFRTISFVKLGLELGWLKGVSLLELNQAMFHCRRGHLLRDFPEEIPQEALAHKRAEYIHKTLAKSELLI